MLTGINCVLFTLVTKIILVTGDADTSSTDLASPISSTEPPKNSHRSTFYISVSETKWCQLYPEDEKEFQDIRNTMKSGAAVMKLYLSTSGMARNNKTALFPMSAQSNSRHIETASVYKYFWMQAVDQPFTGLLLLRPDFDVLSYSLQLELPGPVTFHVLEDAPGCLHTVSSGYFIGEMYI